MEKALACTFLSNTRDRQAYIYLRLAHVYLGLGQCEKGLLATDKGLARPRAMDSTTSVLLDLYKLRTLLAYRLKRFDVALAAVKQVYRLSMDAPSPIYYFLRADIYRRMRLFDQAREVLAPLLRNPAFTPFHGLVYKNQQRIERSAGNMKEARQARRLKHQALHQGRNGQVSLIPFLADLIGYFPCCMLSRDDRVHGPAPNFDLLVKQPLIRVCSDIGDSDSEDLDDGDDGSSSEDEEADRMEHFLTAHIIPQMQARMRSQGKAKQ